MKIALAQLNFRIGDFKRNVSSILESYKWACAQGAELLLTPELGVSGYPPHDLLLRPEMVSRCDEALKEIAAATKGKACALVVGHVANSPNSSRVSNQITIFKDGQTVFTQRKHQLPTYDIFDEARYFEPGTEVDVWELGGRKIVFGICEDLWTEYGRSFYSKLKADLLISISASPYEWGKREARQGIHMDFAKVMGASLIYVNQVGANDEVLFDGGSFVCHPESNVIERLPFFKESRGLVEWKENRLNWIEPLIEGREDHQVESIDLLHRGLVVGIRDYFEKTGFSKTVIGLSGGIDSSVVAALAVEALGKNHVTGIAMPSQHSSGHSLEDAECLAKNLGIRFEVKPIKFLYSMMSKEFGEGRGGLNDLAQENLQARIRGTLLMAIANHENALVLAPGNKSELATGYCTLYGDMVGAVAPIGDLFKTRVYALAQYINQNHEWIPLRSIEKEPSAELRPGQKDTDSLPPYIELDPVLEAYIEKETSVEDLLTQFPGAGEWIPRILGMIEATEYKRRQSAVVLKVSPKAFGVGRRIPVAKIWNQT